MGRVVEKKVNKYKAFKTPEWWEGAKCSKSSSRIHQVVACLKYGYSKLPSGYCVHHIDGNTLNNDPSNLQILTRGEHTRLHHLGVKHTEETKKLMSEHKKGELNPNSKKVMCVETEQVFSTQTEAGQWAGVTYAAIAKSCKLGTAVKGKYHFKYI